MELTPGCVANPEVIHASVNCKGPAHDVVDAAWIQGHLVSKIFSFSFFITYAVTIYADVYVRPSLILANKCGDKIRGPHYWKTTDPLPRLKKLASVELILAGA
jgi:hypothetical protein